jgi:hypothetical protein
MTRAKRVAGTENSFKSLKIKDDWRLIREASKAAAG